MWSGEDTIKFISWFIILILCCFNFSFYQDLVVTLINAILGGMTTRIIQLRIGILQKVVNNDILINSWNITLIFLIMKLRIYCFDLPWWDHTWVVPDLAKTEWKKLIYTYFKWSYQQIINTPQYHIFFELYPSKTLFLIFI